MMTGDDGTPLFVGRDVATALGYSDARKVIRVHVEPEDKGVDEMATPGGVQRATFINESGLYSLILSSKLPQAKAFKRWVTTHTDSCRALPCMAAASSMRFWPVSHAWFY